jgi:hypothetical protein
MHIPSSIPLYNITMQKENLLFYVYADEKYHMFAALYPIFALTSNPQSIVEICLESPDKFVNNYTDIVKFYQEQFPVRVLYSYIENSDIVPNSLRFIVKPQSHAKYIYIGDIDILLLENNILDKHLMNMQKNGFDFSNIVRPGTERLSGLHFIEYDKMFPVQIEREIDLTLENDEALLYKLMNKKGLKMPTGTYRPTHGLHISFFSRPLLSTLTTCDRRVNFPAWGGSAEFIQKYLKMRYSEPIISFMDKIRDDNVKLRQMVQIIDIFCIYLNPPSPFVVKAIYFHVKTWPLIGRIATLIKPYIKAALSMQSI